MNEISIGSGTQNEPASFTRFILPFAFNLRKPYKPHAGPYWERSDVQAEDKQWRKLYLTSETRSVLFSRASWFSLSKEGTEGWQDLELTIPERGDNPAKPLRTSLAAQLVLFESHSSLQEIKPFEKHDLMQTGFLILEARFKKEQQISLDDFMYFNEVFRYFAEPYKDHFSLIKPDKLINNKALKALRLDLHKAEDNEQPNATAGNQQSSESPAYKKNQYYDRWLSLLELPIKINESVGYCHLSSTSKTSQERDFYPDNRTFTWTCAIVQNGACALWPQKKDGDEWRARNYGYWIKLLNIDQPCETFSESNSTREFEREWADEHTYHRWEERGVYYGFTPHSGAMLAPKSTDPPLYAHFGQMYFDQILLLLYLRVVLFRFSKELSDISAAARDTENGEGDWLEAFRRLRWNFALFTNLYQFPLLSNQEQGIEMYTLARKCMNVDDLFKEVQEEIHSSHDYLVQQQGHRQANMATVLSVVATIGLVVAIVLAFFGMDKTLLADFQQWQFNWGRLKPLGIGLAIAFVLLVVLLPWTRAFAWLLRKLTRLK